MRKKMVALVALLAIVLSMFSGCRHEATCDMCGKEAKCHTITVAGEEVDVCSSCVVG